MDIVRLKDFIEREASWCCFVAFGEVFSGAAYGRCLFSRVAVGQGASCPHVVQEGCVHG